jgi:hypothetical protein
VQIYDKFNLPLVEAPNARVERQANGTFKLKETQKSGINPFEKVREVLFVKYLSM